MKLPDKVYDVLKWLALVALSAVGWLYSELANIWGWPYGEAVFNTFAKIALFIGIIIGVSTAEYRKSLLDIANSNATHSFFVNSSDEEIDEEAANYYEQQMNEADDVDEFEYFESK